MAGEEQYVRDSVLPRPGIQWRRDVVLLAYPKSKEFIARAGFLNVYEVEQTPAKQNLTVIFAFNEAGLIVSPHVILPGQRFRNEVVEGLPGSWGIGLNPNGWMDVTNFRLYIKEIFYPYLEAQNVTFSVIFFVDGHTSHKSVEAADLCDSLWIIPKHYQYCTAH